MQAYNIVLITSFPAHSIVTTPSLPGVVGSGDISVIGSTGLTLLVEMSLVDDEMSFDEATAITSATFG